MQTLCLQKEQTQMHANSDGLILHAKKYDSEIRKHLALANFGYAQT